MAKMKALMWYGGWDVRYEDVDIPKVEDDEVLIKISHSGICGSEMHILGGRIDFIPPPTILGHEFSGTVAEVGKKVSGYTEGQKVTAHPFTGCGACYWCKNAKEHFCTDPFNVLTNPRAGGFAEYTIVKGKQVYAVPEEMSLLEAALIEPTSIAIHAMKQANIKPGSTVAVLGAGIIGLQCLQLAQHSGAGMTVLSDPFEKRRGIARKLGADITVDPIKESLVDVVMQATDGYGVDVVIEASGAVAANEAAVPILKNGGTIAIVGVAPNDYLLGVKPYEMMNREIKIHGSFWSPYSFSETIGIMPKIEAISLATHVLPLSQFQEAFKVQGTDDAVKVLFQP